MLGTLSRPIYFVNHTDPSVAEGRIWLAPHSAFETPRGWSRHECETLAEVDALQKRLTEQERRDYEREGIRAQLTFAERDRQVRDSLYQRMISSSTSAYERDFIEAWLKLRDDRKRKIYAAKLEAINMVLYSHNYDIPVGRKDNEESVNIDRINVKS